MNLQNYVCKEFTKLAAYWKGENFRSVNSDSLPENFRQLLDLQDFYPGELSLPKKYNIKESYNAEHIALPKSLILVTVSTHIHHKICLKGKKIHPKRVKRKGQPYWT